MSRRNIKQARELEPKMASLRTRTLEHLLKSYDCAQTYKGKCKPDEELEAAKKDPNPKGEKQCLK